MSFSIVVLCPNGRRETIKVSPNCSTLQVLEEACKRQNINPEDFDLRHSNKILDLTLPIRFSNLSNNAQVELYPAKDSRKDSLVTICLQLESGERFTNDFSPSTSVYDVVERSLRSNSICVQNMEEIVCIYMRQKIVGDSIKTTTLRSLGLTKGQAIIRLLYRKPEDLENQAHVSNPLVAATPSESAKIQKEIKVEKMESPMFDQNSYNIKKSFPGNSHEMNTEKNVRSDLECNENVVKSETGLSVQSSSTDKEELSSIPKHSEENYRCSELSKCHDSNDCFRSNASEKKMKIELDSEVPFVGVGDIKYIGERHAVVYDLNDISEVKKADLPDEFFDLTVDDAKYLLAECKRQRSELENQPLLTKAQRQKQILQNLAHYSQTVIRVYFPERLVLQAVFASLETVQDVSHFIRNYLEDRNLKFYLYITPPKEKLNLSKTLLEAMLVPAAVIYFGCDIPLPTYLVSNLRDRLSDPRAAALAASESRKNSALDSPMDISTTTTMEEEQISSDTPVAMDTLQPSATSHKLEKVPKWLKLSKK